MSIQMLGPWGNIRTPSIRNKYLRLYKQRNRNVITQYFISFIYFSFKYVTCNRELKRISLIGDAYYTGGYFRGSKFVKT